jgi:hypothetical protein
MKGSSSLMGTPAKKLLLKKRGEKKFDSKDLFQSTPRMHDIFNLFI